MVWDILTKREWLKRKHIEYERSLVNKFFSNLSTHGGIVGDTAVLFVYNEQAPELSYIITEGL